MVVVNIRVLFGQADTAGFMITCKYWAHYNFKKTNQLSFFTR